MEDGLVCLNQGGGRVREKSLENRGLRTKMKDGVEGVETSVG